MRGGTPRDAAGGRECRSWCGSVGGGDARRGLARTNFYPRGMMVGRRPTLADSPSFSDEIAANASFLHSVARALVSRSDLADDVAQETARAALEHPSRRAGALRGWLTAIARNVAAKRARSEGRRRERERES